MGVQDISLMSSGASYCTTFLKTCGTGHNLSTAAYAKTVVGCKQWHASSKILLL